MFGMRNKENNFPICTLIWGPALISYFIFIQSTCLIPVLRIYLQALEDTVDSEELAIPNLHCFQNIVYQGVKQGSHRLENYMNIEDFLEN